MTPSQTYQGVRARLLDLASTLDGTAQSTPVPALPGWSVRDTYAHLAGICTDVLTQRLTTLASPEWTAGQVADRARLPFADVCREWADAGPTMDTFLAAPGADRALLMVQDIWQHEQDIHGALGTPADRDVETCTWMATFTLRYLTRKWPGDMPAVRVVAGPIDHTLGEGEVAATLRTDPYELARLTIGRRSRAQILGLDWEGDPSAMLGSLHTFTMPEEPVMER